MIREYYTFQKETSSVIIEDAHIKAVKNKNITEKSIRVFDENNQIFALSAGVGDIRDAELESKAKELLSLKMPYKYELEKDCKADFSKVKLSISDIESFTQSFLSDIKDFSSDFVVSGTASIATYTTTLKNDLNLHLSQKERMLIYNLSLKQKGSGNIADADVSFYGFDISPDKYKDILKSTELLCSTCRSKEVPLVDGSYKILFPTYYILQKFYSDICGNEYETKSSLLTDRLGEQIFHVDISLNESHDNDDYTQFAPCDDEGIIRQFELPIVENGILKNIIYDKKTAQKYGKTSTGNGFRNYNSNPGVSNRLLIFPNISASALSMIANDTVIFPMICSGGDFLPNGNYSLPVQLALVFKNGVFAGKAPQLSITGNYLDTFNKDFISICKNDILKEMATQELIFANAMVRVL